MNNTIFKAMDTMIQWMKDKKGNVSYSMTNRNGPHSYDCSSAVYYALISAGFLPNGYIGNTETLFSHLEQYGWKQVLSDDTYLPGDIFIWGQRGASSGSAGHTGIFINSSEIIHCNYTANGISIDPYKETWIKNERPIATIYRYGSSELPTFFEVQRIPLTGIFVPNQEVYVRAQPRTTSPSLATYIQGQSINYDSYCIQDELIWISYIAYSGNRRYVAIAPNDGISSNIWGSGFDKSAL